MVIMLIQLAVLCLFFGFIWRYVEGHIAEPWRTFAVIFFCMVFAVILLSGLGVWNPIHLLHLH